MFFRWSDHHKLLIPLVELLLLLFKSTHIASFFFFGLLGLELVNIADELVLDEGVLALELLGFVQDLA